jgi:hypothetical protein
MGMQAQFDDILRMEGVKGLILFSFSGEIIFTESKAALPDGLKGYNWLPLAESLAGMREADLVFDRGRLYIRRTEIGYLLILIGPFIPIAMIRLQCDILLPELKPAKAPKGIRKLFKKS